MANDFTPVEVADDKGNWKPLPEGFEATGGPQPTAAEIMPPATPTIKGERTPTVEEGQAGIVRYGVPVAMGVMTGGASLPVQLAAGALSTGFSELTARQLERASTDPTLDEIWNDIKGSATASGLDVGLTLTTQGMGKGLLALGRKLALPRAIPKAAELAQTVLGRASDTAKNVLKSWTKFKGSNDPFSLTLGQLNNEERGFVTWLEGIARGGTGRGIMTKFDARNVEHVSEALSKYFDARTAQMTGPEFGAFIQKTLGTVDNPGEAFKPVEAFKTFLYKRFDDSLEQFSDSTIDGSALRKFLSEAKDPDMLKVYRQAATIDLLPKTLQNEAAWKAIPVQDAEKAIRQINSFFSTTDEPLNKRLKYMRKFISEPFDDFVDSQPVLKDSLYAAKTYFGAKERALYNTTITAMRRAIDKKPSGIAALLDISKGNAAVKYDQLMKLKHGLYFSAAAPSAESIGKPIEKLWEDSVLKPLRFRMVDAASDQYGKLDPNKFMKQIEKIEAEAPEALNELWSSPAQVNHIKELASTYQTLINTVPEKSIFIQLKTAAAVGTVGAATGAGFSYVTGDNPTAGAAIGGALTILISPIVLAKVLTNSKLTRALTDGLSESYRAGGITPTLAMTFRKMAEMKAASTTFREAPSQDAMMFYNFSPVEEVEQSPPEQ
jgi:hypothetical protein